MHIAIQILATLVAVEFLYIMYLETVATTSEKTEKTFNMTTEELRCKSVSTLFKNQGVYNGMIAVLIILAAWVSASKVEIISLMVYIVAVAIYGSITSNPKIILLQGGLAIITLVLCAVL